MGQRSQSAAKKDVPTKLKREVLVSCMGPRQKNVDMKVTVGCAADTEQAKVLIESAVKCKRPAMLMIGEEKFVAKELDIKSRTQFVFC
jgi:hypothetical protein